MKKITVAKIAATTLVSASLSAIPLATVSCAKQDNEVHIMSINDFHGAAPGFGDDYFTNVGNAYPGIVRLAAEVNEIYKAHPNSSMLLSAGDENATNAFSSANHGMSVMPILRQLGIPYSAVGNHTFEWGMGYLTGEDKLINPSNPTIDPLTGKQYVKFDTLGRVDKPLSGKVKTEGNYWLCANIFQCDKAEEAREYTDRDWTSDPSQEKYESDFNEWKTHIKEVKWVDPYKIVNINGIKVCLIGLATQLTRTDGNHSYVDNLAFPNYVASVNYAKTLCKEEHPNEFDKIDSFILLTHCGSEYTYKDGALIDATGEAIELAKDLNTQVDAIISAHSHKEGVVQIENKNGFGRNGKIWVGQANTAAKALLDIKLDVDAKQPAGKKVKDITMNVIGSGSPISIKPKYLNKSSDKIYQKAKTDLEELVKECLSQSKKSMLYKTVSEYLKQKNIIKEICNQPAGKNAYSIFGESYQGRNYTEMKLGHTWYMNKYINEPSGAWANKAQLLGYNNGVLNNQIGATIYGYDNTWKTRPKAAISFFNQDSITYEIPNSKYIDLFDLYQIQTHENYLVQGWLTVGQLWNLINYMLSGGKVTTDYVKDESTQRIKEVYTPGGNDSAFVYGDGNRDYNHYDSDPDGDYKGFNLTKDPIIDSKEYKWDEKDDGHGNKTHGRYLCGPLQFYGFKFEVEAFEETVGTEKEEKWIRQYRVATNDEGTLPRIWIYDPKDPESNPDDPDTWKLVGDTWGVDKLIPTIVNSFVYTGSNFQCMMFKPYFEANETDEYKTYLYDINNVISRDALRGYCYTYKNSDLPEIETNYEFDVRPSVWEKLVVYKE